jgi:hypothetical protein
MTAHGQGGCSDSWGAVNRWSGVSLGRAAWGAAATITGNTLYTCSGFDLGGVEGTFGWSNVIGQGAGNSIVQVGFGRCGDPTNSGACNSAMNFFYAWGRQSSAPGCSGWSTRLAQPQKWDGHNYDSRSHLYWVQQQTSSGSAYWRMYIDGNLVKQEPMSSFCWTPGDAQWFAETWDHGDELGGEPSAPMNFTGMMWSPSRDGTWYSTAFSTGRCHLKPSDSYYVCNITSSTSISAYTNR